MGDDGDKQEGRIGRHVSLKLTGRSANRKDYFRVFALKSVGQKASSMLRFATSNGRLWRGDVSGLSTYIQEGPATMPGLVVCGGTDGAGWGVDQMRMGMRT